MVTGPEGDYTHTPRGTLLQIDDGSNPVVYDFDPFGRLTTVDAVSYSYDGLDRVSTRGSDTFTYQGFSLDPTSDSTHTYSRSPAGRLVGITEGTTNLLVGADRHGDLTHLHDPTGTVSDTVVYDPYGDPLTTTGTFNPQVGYQGDWTDPTTGHVWIGARWYQATSATFLSRDTVFGELTTPISLNRYTYAWANPNMFWDPDGHASTFIADGQWYGGTTTSSSSTSSSSSSSSSSGSNTVDVETAFMTQTVKKTSTSSEKAEETIFVQEERQDALNFTSGHEASPSFWWDFPWQDAAIGPDLDTPLISAEGWSLAMEVNEVVGTVASTVTLASAACLAASEFTAFVTTIPCAGILTTASQIERASDVLAIVDSCAVDRAFTTYCPADVGAAIVPGVSHQVLRTALGDSILADLLSSFVGASLDESNERIEAPPPFNPFGWPGSK